MLGPDGEEINQNCTMYVTQITRWETVSHEEMDNQLGWAGYEVPDVGPGGLDTAAMSANPSVITTIPQYFDAVGKSQLYPGAQRRLY